MTLLTKRTENKIRTENTNHYAAIKKPVDLPGGSFGRMPELIRRFDELRAKEIPEAPPHVRDNLLDWKKVPIVEASPIGEQLQLLTNFPRLAEVGAWPAYYKNPDLPPADSGLGELARAAQGRLCASPLVFVRPEIVPMLNRAQEILDTHPETRCYKLLVVDAYRDLNTQAVLFETYENWLGKQHPDLPPEQLDLRAQRMVSKPVTGATLCQSPPHHLTGGAVDLILTHKSKLDTSKDSMARDASVNFGSEFDEMMHPEFGDKRSGLRYFELLQKDRTLTPQEAEALNFRRDLWAVMTTVGFSCYPDEFWHYQYGTQLDAYFKEAPAASFGCAQTAYMPAFWKHAAEALPRYVQWLETNGMEREEILHLAKRDYGLDQPWVGQPPFDQNRIVVPGIQWGDVLKAAQSEQELPPANV